MFKTGLLQCSPRQLQFSYLPVIRNPLDSSHKRFQNCNARVPVTCFWSAHLPLTWLTSYLSNRTQCVQLNVPAPSRQSSPVVHLKARSSDRSCFFYTPQTSPDWWARTTFKSICTRTTHRCTASVIQMVQQVFRMPFLPVSTTYLRG